MLNAYILSAHLKRLPFLISKRYKVRMLTNPRDSPFDMAPKNKPGKAYTTEFFALANRKDLSLNFWIRRWKARQLQDIKDDQKFLAERHQILGPNLATAHFICARGGKVKFKGSDKWFSLEDLKSKKLPNTYVAGYFVEEIDASDTNLCYEGFQNLCNLEELKKLSLHNCPFVDDWCLSRSYLFEHSLEFLDVSGCKNVSERGICTLHILKKLKTLVLNDTPGIENKELVSLLLQDVIPQLDVVGVNLDDPELLKRLESVSGS